MKWKGQLGPAFMSAWGRPRGEKQSEHVSIYGPSNSGKSYFMCHIIDARARLRGSHAVMIATKKADATLSDSGWPVVHDWPPDWDQRKVIFWARGGLSDEQQEKQAERVSMIMNELWVPDSNTIVAWDELTYVCADLKLRRPITTYYREGRGCGITNVAVMQRPTEVSRYVHSESHWTVAFAPKDQDDRERVAEVFGNRGFYRDVLDDLDREKHEFLIRHELTGEAYISSLPGPVRPRRSDGYRRSR